jgi:hypothetical protein
MMYNCSCIVLPFLFVDAYYCLIYFSLFRNAAGRSAAAGVARWGCLPAFPPGDTAASVDVLPYFCSCYRLQLQFMFACARRNLDTCGHIMKLLDTFQSKSTTDPPNASNINSMRLLLSVPIYEFAKFPKLRRGRQKQPSGNSGDGGKQQQVTSRSPTSAINNRLTQRQELRRRKQQTSATHARLQTRGNKRRSLIDMLGRCPKHRAYNMSPRSTETQAAWVNMCRRGYDN